MEPSSLREFESLANEKLNPIWYQFYKATADDGICMRRNQEAFAEVKIIPQYLQRPVDKRDLSVSLLNGSCKLKTPIGASPTAVHGHAHPDGELATVKALTAAGSILIQSAWSSFTLEQVAEAAGPEANIWLNIYIYRWRNRAFDLIRRAEKAGFKAIVVTVDIQVIGNCPARKPVSENLRSGNIKINAAHFHEGEELQMARDSDPSATWADFAAICRSTHLPVIAKGVISAAIAKNAVAHGAKGVIVSTHGGRQLDSLPASIEQLSEVVRAVGDQCDVYLDSGVRRGSDVFKALALGAKAVFLGRPILWGLAYGGESGVKKVIDMITEELSLEMTLTGCSKLAEINTEFVRSAHDMRSKL